MIDIEIPLGKRTKAYRLFEMLPATISYGLLIMMFILSILSPLLAAIYLLIIIVTMLISAIGVAIHTINGNKRLKKAQVINWAEKLSQLEDPVASYAALKNRNSEKFDFETHKENLRLISADPASFPKPSSLYNAVIVVAYNESYEVIEPTIQSIVDTTYNNKQTIMILSCEERGGPEIKNTIEALKAKFGKEFKSFHSIVHPKNLPDEIIGKGGNANYAGRYLKDWLDKEKIDYKNVIVTTLDCDNKPHEKYFDYLTYEYIVHENRKHLAFQPVSLFLNNIWDVPAPMRVLATGNSFWNIISSMRPHALRNFASHSQPMEALVEMDFWSARTIVEDGHQYWRSYFFFGGNYSVIPLYIPIYQDAVLSDTYVRTLKAQFTQLRRWGYGASDIPYVATRLFSKNRNVPFFDGLVRFIRLLEGHITLACVPIIITIGGWIPLLINNEASRNIAAHQLPEMVSIIQRIAMIGLFITIYLGFKMLPPRPLRYRRHRSVLMILQWVLMPVTAICYNALSAFNAQTRLFLGKYLVSFDVTEKATHASVSLARKKKASRGSSS